MTSPAERWDVTRRAFREFLAVPTALIGCFLLLAAAMNALDRVRPSGLEPARTFLATQIFTNPQATADLLATIAGGIMSVTSITISLLLIALQQSAGSMTSEVFDQFLRRPVNQSYFGFFVGLALYALVTLATVGDAFNPILGASAALALVVVALYSLILLLYTTINQMRPGEIIARIHDHILAARERQLDLVRRTRRSPTLKVPAAATVRSATHGFVTGIDVTSLGRTAEGIPGDVEIVLRVSIGSHVAFGDVIAEVRGGVPGAAESKALLAAVHIERERDITVDPVYGIKQMEAIAWTSISSSKSNPAPGLLTIRNLRDVMARWSTEPVAQEPDAHPAPVVYSDDTFAQLLHALESLAVVSTESMQHQNFTEIVRTFAGMFSRLPLAWQSRAEDLVLRALSGMADHVLTAELDTALNDLASALADAGRPAGAAAVRQARSELARSVGKLNSRSTRKPATA